MDFLLHDVRCSQPLRIKKNEDTEFMNCAKVKLEYTQNSRSLAVVRFTNDRKIFGGRSTDRVASVTPL